MHHLYAVDLALPGWQQWRARGPRQRPRQRSTPLMSLPAARLRSLRPENCPACHSQCCSSSIRLTCILLYESMGEGEGGLTHKSDLKKGKIRLASLFDQSEASQYTVAADPMWGRLLVPTLPAAAHA